jgi:stage II sporulation protein AA (anti-sigma F factor antagonist)
MEKVMNIEYLNSENNAVFIKLSGDMDAYGCSKIGSDLENIVDPAVVQHISLDIDDVTFLDSSGVGVIVFLFKRLKATGGTLEINNVNGQPKELIKLLRVGSVIPVRFK